MLRLDNWLYHYVSIYVRESLCRALAVMAPSLVYRPALQHVRTPQAWRYQTQTRQRYARNLGI